MMDALFVATVSGYLVQFVAVRTLPRFIPLLHWRGLNPLMPQSPHTSLFAFSLSSTFLFSSSRSASRFFFS